MRTPYQSQEMQMMGYQVQPSYPIQVYPPMSMYPPTSLNYPMGPPMYTSTASQPYLPPQPTWQEPEQQRQSGY